MLGITSNNGTPFLSSILVIKIGSMYIPLFTNVLYAPTISYRLRSGVPRAIDGTSGKYELIPIFFIKATTGFGPT